jgi:hypothetical protein
VFGIGGVWGFLSPLRGKGAGKGRDLEMNEMRTCRICNQNKPFTDYFLRLNTKGHRIPRNNTCKICHYRTVRRKERLGRYGLNIQQYEDLAQEQNNQCALCGVDPSDKRHNGRGRLAVDHCHVTGRVRGLLCTTCNIGLGKFEDNISLLSKAIEYLSERESG